MGKPAREFPQALFDILKCPFLPFVYWDFTTINSESERGIGSSEKRKEYTMNKVFVDQSGFEYIRYLSAEPRTKYVDGVATDEQDRDENGTPFYGVVCLAKQKGATKPDTITVKIALSQPPSVEEFSKIGFVGLSALAYVSGNRAQMAFSAEKMGKTKE